MKNPIEVKYLLRLETILSQTGVEQTSSPKRETMLDKCSYALTLLSIN
jgi:hypothetical protein